MAIEVAPDHLVKWITRKLADLTEDGAPNRFELFHTVDGGAERLEIFPSEDADASDLAQAIYDAAHHDCSTRDNRAQRYTVCLFRSEDQREPEQQYPFRITQRPGAAWTGGDTEQPTEKGREAQQMRMQNESHLTIMRFADATAGRLTHIIDKLDAKLEVAEDKLRQRNVDFEDLQDRRMDREVARAELLQRQKFYGDIVGSLIPLMPHIAGGILGKLMGDKKDGKTVAKAEAEAVTKALVPKNAEASSRETVLREMFDSMTDEEKQGLVMALAPMHRMVLLSLMGQAQNVTNDLEKAAFDAGMQKFLKGLASDEVMGILSALDQSNQTRFMLVYQSYGKSEEAAQEGLPDLLKDQPEPPKPEPTGALKTVDVRPNISRPLAGGKKKPPEPVEEAPKAKRKRAPKKT
jgi:hypothetical protein